MMSSRDFHENSDFTQKIDVLEMLIEILREHEEKLDEISERLEAVAKITEEHYNAKT